MKTDEELREEAKIIAQELVEKMGIEKVAFTTSVTIRPETTYYGWANGQYATEFHFFLEAALILRSCLSI